MIWVENLVQIYSDSITSHKTFLAILIRPSGLAKYNNFFENKIFTQILIRNVMRYVLSFTNKLFFKASRANLNGQESFM